MKEPKKPGATEGHKQRPTVERRRVSLPQPDFSYYKKLKAYPGSNYFFVGHSYNVELHEGDSSLLTKRGDAIKSFFNENKQWVTVEHSLSNETFCATLTRVEHDLLTRLPEHALIGPAIDEHGHLIPQSFTVWREERRKQRAEKEETTAAK